MVHQNVDLPVKVTSVWWCRVVCHGSWHV